MFAKFPRSSSDSKPSSSTPAPAPRRRIRCKSCRWVVGFIYAITRYDYSALSWRQELAAREHMLGHGQLGLATSSVGAFTPMDYRPPSMNNVEPRIRSLPHPLGGDLGKPLMTQRGSSRGSFSETKGGFLGLAAVGREMSETLSMSAEDGPGIERENKPDTLSVGGFVHPHGPSAQLHANPQLAALRTTDLPKSTTQPSTLASTPPILVDQRCSGYFVEAVCPYDSLFHLPRSMVLDEMDGSVSGKWGNGWQDYLPEQKVRREVGKLRLGRRTL